MFGYIEVEQRNSMKGGIENLLQSPIVIWRGWVVYGWDYGFEAYLFNSEPETDEMGCLLDDAIEGIDPFFLQACGIPVEFDKEGEAGVEFYYGKNSDGHGKHVPIYIELHLPKALLEQIGLLQGE